MIYVMSDIHGHAGRYQSIMRQINLQKDDKLYVLGDCIDRNPYGLDILQDLCSKSNVEILLGNHEHMMLRALTSYPDEPDLMHLWYCNGGFVTHEHFNRCSKIHQNQILDIIEKLKVNVEVQCNGIHYLLVHGAPIGFKSRRDDLVQDAVWIRLEKSDVMPEGKTVIFGHTPTDYYRYCYPPQIYHGERMIGIDCGGAYERGRLACLRLDDMKEFYSTED